MRGRIARGESSGGNSLSDLLVFGKRAGEYAAKWAQQNPAGSVNEDDVGRIMRDALAPFERGTQGENAFAVQHDLQDMMHDNCGIVRDEEGMIRALSEIERLRQRAAQVGVPGHREYNPGWHTALDLNNLLIVSEALARSGLDRKESRGAHTRMDFPDKDDGHSHHNTVLRKGPDGEMQLIRLPLAPVREDLQELIKEMG